jgi:ankyrin repeat protein
MLLDHGAKADVENDEGETPLHLVSRGMYDTQEHGVNIARLLLEHGVDIHAQNKFHQTALHSAAFSGRLEITQLLLDHGANPNAENGLGLTPLHSVSAGKYDSQEHGVGIARLLLGHGADVDARAKDKFTPLHSAAFNGRLELARVLLGHGANTNAKDEWGNTPLHDVSRGEYDSLEHGVGIARLLLEHGVDVHAMDKFHETALPLAAFRGRLEIAQVLLGHGANPNVEDEYGWTPLHLVSEGKYNSHEHDVSIARLLLEHGADVNLGIRKFTPLHSASFNGRLELARVLLNHGAGANAKDEFGNTPLHQVSRGEYDSQEHGVGIARLLLEHGVDVHAKDKDLDTALHWAAFLGRLEVTQVLLEHGANPKVESGERSGHETPLHSMSEGRYNSQEHGVDIHARGKYDDTPLHCAALSGRLEITQLLLNHGANPNIENEQQATPLHLVARGEYDSLEHGVGTARLLLERGVNPAAPDKDRNTPLHLASYLGRLEIAQLLLDHGAEAGSENDQAQTPLHLVSQTNYWFQDAGLRVAKLLLERGADMNARDKDYVTPLHLACYRGRLDIARVLLDYDAKAQEND